MTNILKFHLVQDFPEQLVLPPLASKKLIPDWFKKIPSKNEDDWTVKKCVPFIDAMGVGYTILSHMDIYIYQMKDGNVRIYCPDEKHQAHCKRWPPIETHPQRQFPGSPMSGYTIIKYMSPWIIETPPEYSTLFLPPINRLEIPIIPLVGLVDTDTYFNNVNIPFIHTAMQPDEQKHIIPAGTPICQVIPFKRDEWKSEYTWLNKGSLDKQKEEREKITSERVDWYKKNSHQKKKYV
tara:strand:- start:711 stop:1421 length:711 start_codon:yes stop_codon:yes gene_type:complete